MRVDEQAHDEWRRLVQDWRSVWDPWNEAMDRNTWAFSRGENPETADFKLADQLDQQVKAAEAKMDEFRGNLMQRCRFFRVLSENASRAPSIPRYHLASSISRGRGPNFSGGANGPRLSVQASAKRVGRSKRPKREMHETWGTRWGKSTARPPHRRPERAANNSVSDLCHGCWVFLGRSGQTWVLRVADADQKP